MYVILVSHKIILVCLCWHIVDCEIATISTLSAIDDDSLYFEIIEPVAIGFTYKIRVSKHFGKPFLRTYMQVDLVPSKPYDACTSIIDPQIFYNKVILAKRGGCSFMTKAVKAQNAGALAVIITDYDRYNDVSYISMAGDQTNRIIDIPAAFILGKDGDMIIRELEKTGIPRAVINIPINITSINHRLVNLPPWDVW